MKVFTQHVLVLTTAIICLFAAPATGYGQANPNSVLNPNDSVITYNPNAKLGSLSNPGIPTNYDSIYKWIRTVRLSWNTDEWKCYIIHTIPFRLHYPKSYNPTANDGRKYPIIVFWHGDGEAGPATDNEYSLANGGPVFQSAVDDSAFDGYVLVFQSPGAWSDPFFTLATQVINYMVANNKLDPYRVISNGLSAGGYATWGFDQMYPQYVAAALPMSGITLADGYPANIQLTRFTPTWDFQGGLDTGPDPVTAGTVISELQAAGADITYTLYPTLGHGTWNTAWAEPNFFPYCNAAYLSNPWPLGGRTQFCPNTPINVTLGVPPGCDAYVWRRNGVVIPSATADTVNINSIGTYDCQVERGGIWSDFSHTPTVISIMPPTVTPPITVSGLESRVIPSPASTSVTLKVPAGYQTYTWQQVGDTATLSTDSTLTVSKPGSYIAQVTQLYGCSSNWSPAYVVADSNGPHQPSPASQLIATALSQTSQELDWSRNPTPQYPETHYEVYETTKPTGAYTLVAITGPGITRDTVKGLTPGTEYYYVVRAVDSTSASPLSNQASASTTADTVPPTAPGNLTISSTSRNSITVSWTASTDNVGVVAYDIYVNGNKLYTAAPTQTTFTVDELVNAQEYAITVKARDQAGNNSAASNQVTGEPLINGIPWQYFDNLATNISVLPNFLTLVPEANGVSPTITLAPATDPAYYAFLWQGYIVIPTTGTYTFELNSRDGSDLYLGTLNGVGSPYTPTGKPTINDDGIHSVKTVASSPMSLTAGIYPIAITHFNQTGTDALNVYWKIPGSNSYVSIPASAFIQSAVPGGAVPAAPSNLQAKTLSYNSIGLTWKDNSNNETGFEIYRSTDDSTGYAILQTTGAGVTSFTDNTVTPGTRYYYQIRSINQNGASIYVSSYTEAEWKFNNNYADSSGNNRTLTPIGSPTFDATTKAEGGYSVKLNGTNQAITINNTNSFLQETYYQRTIACWVKSSSTTGANRVIWEVGGSTNGLALVLNNTTLTAAVASASKRVSITTTYSSTGWNHVAVVYYGDSLLLYVNGVLAASNTNLGFHSLATTTDGARIGETNGTNALNTTGSFFGGWIDDFNVYNTALTADVITNLMNLAFVPSNATTSAAPAAPTAPTGLTAAATSATAVLVNWTDTATNVLNYKLYRSNNNDQAYVLIATLPASQISYKDSGLFATATYFYKVDAVGAGGASAFAPEVSVQTQDVPPVVTAIASRNMRYGTTLTLPVTAVSPGGSALTLSGSNLPSFATLVDNGNGTGSLTLAPPSGTVAVFNNITVTATDTYGGTGSTVFNLTVNGNYIPVIGAIANVSMNEGDSLTIPVTATDSTSTATLTWSANQGPNSTSIASSGNGTANLVLKPSFASAGVYTVNVNVNDGMGDSATQAFQVTVVKQDPNVYVYMRVKYANTIGAPWNSMTGPTMPNMLDANGNQTTMGVNFLQSWWMPFDAGPTTGNNSGVYPDAVLNDFWYFGYYGGPNTAAVAWVGLNQAKKYNVTLYAGSVYSGETNNGTTIYTIGSQSQSLYVQDNTQNTVTFSSVSPDSTGAITINMQKATGTPIGYLNAMVLTQLYDDGTVPASPSTLTAQNVPGQGVQLNWIDSAYNAISYVVYRSTSATGGYSVIGTLPTGATSYMDSSISGLTTYYYTVQATNSHGSSLTTDTASATTTDRIPTLSPVASITMKNTGDTTITVTATDDPTDHVTMTATNLPSFATFVDNGNGTATITIQPSAGVIGVFSNITVTGTDMADSSRSVSFNLYVTDPNVASTYVNFTNPNFTAPAPWNNMAIPFIPYAGFALSGLTDDGNNATGATVTLTDAWAGVSTTGVRFRNGSCVYPESVEWTGLYATDSSTRRITVTGLNPALNYNFVFYNSDGTSSNSSTNFTIDGQTVTVNGSYNANKTAQINGIASDGTGTVTIYCQKASAAAFGLLSAMVIEAYTPGVVGVMSPADLRVLDWTPGKAITLQWQNRASNATGYEVWRSTGGQAYTRLVALGAGVTSYKDSGLAANTAYDYTVRAVDGSNYSAYSNTVRGYAYGTTVYIHFNALGTGTDVAAPWNNLNWVYGIGATWFNFNDDSGVPTNVGMVQPVKVDGEVSPGYNTGNNSGVFPDNILNQGWGEFPGDTAVALLNGLDLTKVYDMTLTASLINYPGENSVVFMVNGQTCLFNSLNNYTGTVTIHGLVPDQTGQLKLSFTGYPTATFGMLNAMVLRGYNPSSIPTPAAPGTGGTGGATTGSQAVTAMAATLTQDSTNVLPLGAFPNPFTSNFTLTVPAKNGDNVEVRLLDNTGRVVYVQEFDKLYDGNNTLPIQPPLTLARGFYFVQVLYGNKTNQKTIKLIKE